MNDDGEPRPPSGYQLREDSSFGRRFILTLFLASLPLMVFLVVAVLAGWPMAVLIGGLVALSALELVAVAMAFRTTRCPQCGMRVPVPWRDGTQFQPGGLRYTCDACRIVWVTRVEGGGSGV